jgi:prefoldin alpha subunit
MKKKTETNEEIKEEKQKDLFEINMLDMQLRQCEQQMMALEQQILEQQTISFNLDELKKAKQGQKALFPFSRDIFIEGKLENTESVIIGIGSRIAAKKSIDEAKSIVEKQREMLLKASDELKSHVGKIISRIEELEQKINA